MIYPRYLTGFEKKHIAEACMYLGYKLVLDGQIVLHGFEWLMLETRLSPFCVELIP